MRTTSEQRPHAAATAGVFALSLVAAMAGCAPRTRQSGVAARDANTATAAELQSQKTGRVEELFAGRFPGVQAYASQGGIIVRVRGASTLSGNSQPLFVIDGQPVQVGSNGLVAINPSDVARIEVVKDAADLAMYGSRGGNGVVKITTKRPPRRG